MPGRRLGGEEGGGGAAAPAPTAQLHPAQHGARLALHQGALCRCFARDTHATILLSCISSVLFVYTQSVIVTLFGPVDEDTTWMDLVSSVGGLLGLFMGFSFITIGEICYFFGVGLFTTFCQFLKKKCKKSEKIMPFSE